MIAFKQASNLAFVDTLRCDSSSQKFSTISGNDKFQGDLVVIFPKKTTALTGQGEAPKDQRAEGSAFGEAQGLLGSEDPSF